MTRKRKIATLRSLEDIPDSWDLVTSCKHFLPCDAVVSGNIQDVKGAVICAPQDDDGVSGPVTFEYDAATNSVRSTAGNSNTHKALVSGNWASLPSGKSMLFMTAGYLSPPAVGGNTTRCAIGNTASGTGFGMSNGNCHSIISRQPFDAPNSSGSDIAAIANLYTEIEAQMGATGYFVRYALYRPDGSLLEHIVYNGTTGVVLTGLTNNRQYIGSAVMGLTDFTAAFRMHGYRSTGIAVFHFDTVPSDYKLGVISMASLWKQNKRVIWPFWP